MSAFDEKELDQLIHLCRIECTDEEKKALKHHLGNVLQYIEQLNEVDVEGVEPCNSVLESIVTPLREDKVDDILSRELFLANAPAHVGGMIRVPPVIKFSNP